MTQKDSQEAIELAATEREGNYDPPWSLPALVNTLLKRKLASWALELPQGSRVLDIGCARGDLLHLIGKNRPDLELVGVDLSAGMAALAKRRSSRLKIFQADGTRLPFADETFDLVIVMHLLSNLDPERVAPALVREAYRVSRSWMCTEIKVPAILNMQLTIRKVLLGIPGLRLLARFLFALPPASSPPIDVYVHQPETLLSGMAERGRIRPWSLLPVPSRMHLVLRREHLRGEQTASLGLKRRDQ